MIPCLALPLLPLAGGCGAGGPSIANPEIARRTASQPASGTGLGPGASLAGRRPFPADNPWNQDISSAPVDPNSAALIASIGPAPASTPTSAPSGTAPPSASRTSSCSGTQPQVPVSFDYADESDPGPTRFPPDAPIEGGPNASGDRHVLVIDRDNWKLYELFAAHPNGGGWQAGSGAVFDLNSTRCARPAGPRPTRPGCRSSPGCVRYDEVVEQGAIRHALRFTVAADARGPTSRRPGTSPAADTDANLPPMGMRVRLKASFDIARFPPKVQVILTAHEDVRDVRGRQRLELVRLAARPTRAGTTTSCARCSQVKGSDFEVVKMGTVVTR